MFYSNGLVAIRHNFADIMHFKVNSGRKSAILNLIDLKFFSAYPSVKSHFGFIVMVWLSGTVFQILNRIKSIMATSPLGHFEYYLANFITAFPSVKMYILLYGNGLAIWYGYPDITHIFEFIIF